MGAGDLVVGDESQSEKPCMMVNTIGVGVEILAIVPSRSLRYCSQAAVVGGKDVFARLCTKSEMLN